MTSTLHHLGRRLPTLVTGITGFAGCWLASALTARGETVVGLSRASGWPPAWEHLAGAVEFRRCDLGDALAVRETLAALRPARIYHLAGFASVGASFRDPLAAWAGNLTATLNLLEAARAQDPRPRILYVGSGMVYGPPRPDGLPFTEECLLEPDTPYSASKAAADLACKQYTASFGLDIVRVRPFNHVGPHQSPEFAIPRFARQLAAIERGQVPPVLETGNLEPERDFTDVRDVVQAYLLLMDQGQSGEAYNVASGQSVSMREVLGRLLALTGLRVEVRQNADLLRPAEPVRLRADAAKVRRQTGWVPRFPLDQTLADTLTAWRQRP